MHDDDRTQHHEAPGEGRASGQPSGQPSGGEPSGGAPGSLDPQDRAAFRGTPGATGEDGAKPDWPQDPGAYIGHEPELAADTIPGGLGPQDERVAAHSTQGTGVGRPDERGQLPREPGGHRDADGIPGEPS